LGSPHHLDSRGSLRASSFITFTPAVLTSPGFAETVAPSSPPRIVEYPAMGGLKGAAGSGKTADARTAT